MSPVASSAPRLPPELLQEIVLHSRSHGALTLARLASTCRLLQSEAEPFLYETIDMQSSWPPKPHHFTNEGFRAEKKRVSTSTSMKDYTDRYLSFFMAVKNNTRIAGYVKAFFSYEDLRLDHYGHIYWRLLGDALANLHNLKTFVFQHRMADPLPSVFNRCTAQLECFSWTCGRVETDTRNIGRIHSILGDFLARQTSLVTLHIDGWEAHPTPSLPRLTTLIGPPTSLVILSENRSMSSWVWLPDMPGNSVGLEAFLPCLSQIRTLVVKIQLSDVLARLIFPHLKELENLDIVNVVAIPGESFFEIGTLIHLKLSHEHSCRSGYIMECFQRLPQLQVLDVKMEKAAFRRYLRGSIDEPQTIRKSILEWCPIKLP